MDVVGKELIIVKLELEFLFVFSKDVLVALKILVLPEKELSIVASANNVMRRVFRSQPQWPTQDMLHLLRRASIINNSGDEVFAKKIVAVALLMAGVEPLAQESR
jgi:hypothetical protein